MFSTTWCPHCTNLKRYLEKFKIEHTIIEMDVDEGGVEITKELKDLTGNLKVPRIFIAGVNRGGFQSFIRFMLDPGTAKLFKKHGIKSIFDEPYPEK